MTSDAREVLTYLLGQAECVHCGEVIVLEGVWIHKSANVGCRNGANPATSAFPKPLDPSQVLRALGDAGMLVKPDAAAMARAFHENYLRLADRFGWEPQRESVVYWSDLPASNRALMMATAQAVIDGHGFTWAQPAESDGAL